MEEEEAMLGGQAGPHPWAGHHAGVRGPCALKTSHPNRQAKGGCRCDVAGGLQ